MLGFMALGAAGLTLTTRIATDGRASGSTARGALPASATRAEQLSLMPIVRACQILPMSGGAARAARLCILAGSPLIAHSINSGSHKIIMISYLKGKIKHKAAGFVILEVSNIGYQIFVASLLHADLNLGQDFEFWTHQQVREDGLNLYGFSRLEELELFEMLIGISGIGPKSALGIMSIATAADIKESIVRGDPALLTKVSGIGRKTADRVVLELREKISKLSFKDNKLTRGGLGSSDEIDALMALGYSLSQAREALNGVEAKIKDSGERIRQALKKMGK